MTITRPPAELRAVAAAAHKHVCSSYAALVSAAPSGDPELVAIRRRILKLIEDLEHYLYHYGEPPEEETT